eukprot:NODE_16_length_41655_cov_0.272813.p6 type:complete len:503 gc:universal NODE_16_length_41655_cov_0.272813:4878-6386(+)
MSTCPNCNSSNLISDTQLAHIVCEDCGQIVSENAIVSEVQFVESGNSARAVGSTVNESNSSNQQTSITHARRTISQISYPLNLPESIIDTAHRYYKLALINKQTMGRKHVDVCAACIYIACRLNETPILLIDLSDVTKSSVFVMGNIFMHLLKALNLKVPIMDPALYISRFTAMLNLGDKTSVIAKDAVRLVQRFNRDWIQTGRRPNGICGAALLIASRMNGVELPTHDIERLVKISAHTIQKRLQEFSGTDSAKFSGSDFQSQWLNSSKDPPSFSQNRKIDNEKEYNVMQQLHQQRKLMESIVNDIDDEGFAEEIQMSVEDVEAMKEHMESALPITETNTLSDLEDDLVVNEMILSKEASEVKAAIWHKEYEHDLKEMEIRNTKPKSAVKKRKAKETFSSVSEAIKKKVAPKLSKKLNYDLMQVLDFNDAREQTTLPLMDMVDDNKSIITLSSYRTNKTGLSQATHLTRASLFSTKTSQFKFQRLENTFGGEDYNAYDEYD